MQRKARKGTTLRLFYAECLLTSNMCLKITTETEQYTTYSKPIFTKRSCPSYLKRYITSSGSASIAVSKVIGTAKKTILFGILVFLETQEINLRGNLLDIKCDILHIFMRIFFVLRKSSFPPLTLQFSSKHFYPRHRLCFVKLTLFSNAATLQSRLSDSSKHRLQEKCFLLRFLQQLEICLKKVCNKVI